MIQINQTQVEVRVKRSPSLLLPLLQEPSSLRPQYRIECANDNEPEEEKKIEEKKIRHLHKAAKFRFDASQTSLLITLAGPFTHLKPTRRSCNYFFQNSPKVRTSLRVSCPRLLRLLCLMLMFSYFFLRSRQKGELVSLLALKDDVWAGAYDAQSDSLYFLQPATGGVVGRMDRKGTYTVLSSVKISLFGAGLAIVSVRHVVFTQRTIVTPFFFENVISGSQRGPFGR